MWNSDYGCYILKSEYYFVNALASPSTYPCQSMGEWVSGSVIKSFRFGDSYRISELCELVGFTMCGHNISLA